MSCCGLADVTHARATFRSLYGLITSSWSITNTTTIVRQHNVTVPPNCVATLAIEGRTVLELLGERGGTSGDAAAMLARRHEEGNGLQRVGGHGWHEEGHAGGDSSSGVRVLRLGSGSYSFVAM